MKEFGVEESWTQFLKISYPNLQPDYKLCEWDEDYVGRLVPLCLSEKGDTLILTINSGDQAIFYNWRDNRLKRIKSTYKIWWYSAQNYVESLVWYRPVESKFLFYDLVNSFDSFELIVLLNDYLFYCQLYFSSLFIYLSLKLIRTIWFNL